jgi:hypothetical protein
VSSCVRFDSDDDNLLIHFIEGKSFGQPTVTCLAVSGLIAVMIIY